MAGAQKSERLLPTLLLVDENRESLKALADNLHSEMPGCRIFSTTLPAEAAVWAARQAVDCAIIAANAGGGGIALCRKLKNDPRTDGFPVLLVTSGDSEPHAHLLGLEAGADDFLYRASEPVEILAKIRVMLRVKRAENELRAVNQRLADLAEERSRALHETDLRYRLLFESCGDGVFVYALDERDEPGRIIEANDPACRWLGWTREEITRLSLGDLIAPDRAASLPARIESILQHRQVSFESVLIARDGRRVSLFITAGLVLLDNVRAIVNVARRHDDAPAPGDEGGDYRFLAGQTGLLIYDCNVKTGKIAWGGAAMQVVGYSPQEMAAFGWRSWQRRIHPDDRPRVLARLREALDQVGKYQMEYRLTHKSGEHRYVEDMGVALTGPDGRAVRVLGTIKDVTARVRADEERRRVESELQHSQRLESLGVLAGGIAHDFNNILAGIIGLTDLALMDIPPGSRTHGDLREALQGAHRAKELVKQILAFSRQTGQERAPLYLHVIAREALKLLRASLPTNIEIIDSVDVHSGAVMANAAQMHQVIMNFCTNAAQAMSRKGGTLELRLADVEVDEPQAAVLPRLHVGPYVRLSVHDTGHGMAPQVLARVFDPFFTTKGPGEGTGMGLAVVHGIISDHGGAVTAESRPGAGSSFHAYLPRVAGVAVEEFQSASPVRGGGGSILFVDDDAAVLRFADLALPRLGYTVTLCGNGEEALSVFEAGPGRFDLVITDLVMPGMAGDEVARRIHAVRPELPIILFTGHSHLAQAGRFRDAGISAVMAKPVTVNDLVMEIRRQIQENTQP